MTNLHKTKEQIIYEIMLSLNNGNCGYLYDDGEATPRIDLAIEQYDALVKRGVIQEL